MKSKEYGLTVGELTMAIGALIIAGLIWSTINRKDDNKEAFNNISLSPLISTKIMQPTK